jgi:transposase
MNLRSREAPPTMAVPMLDSEIVRQIRALSDLGWGAKRISDAVGASRNAVRRYLRLGAAAEVQVRPQARQLDADQRALAVELLEGEAAGNAVVVQRLLHDRGVEATVRTVQRAVETRRQERRAAELATVRFETAPGHQMQIDFGERRISIGGVLVRVFLFVAVLGYSRRIFVRATLGQRQDDWREGLAGAFRCFGGVPQALLIDRAGALVIGQDAASGTARIHPAFAAFCRDWGVDVRACRPYRARTKGKVESGVGYVKRNAIAGRSFESFEALQRHLERWCGEADDRVHGTTHERPCERFDRDERHALRPLPVRALPVRTRRVTRRVATDCFVDVDTIRYSVPHQLVRRTVEVLVADDEVLVYDGTDIVARHRRSFEPYARIADPAHFMGLYRGAERHEVVASSPYERSLDVYAECLGGAP